MNPHSFATAAAMLTVLLSIGPALAGDTRLSAAEEAVFNEAIDAANKKDWALCRTRAAGVWDKNKDPTVAALLGTCEAELGMSRDAAEHLDFFSQRDDGTKPKQTESVKKRLAIVRPKVMLVEISSEPAADVRVGGVVVGTTPLRLWLEPGSHRVEIGQTGYTSKVEEITATAGGSQKLDEKLEPVQGAGTGGATGTGGSGGAGDGGNGSGGAGGGDPDVPSGEKSVPVLAVGGVLAGAGLITGSVLLGLGISAGKESADKRDALGGTNPCGAGTPHTAACEEIADLDGRYTSFTIGGGIALGAGAALGIAVLVYALVPEEPDTKDAARIFIAPMIEPDQRGLLVQGRF